MTRRPIRRESNRRAVNPRQLDASIDARIVSASFTPGLDIEVVIDEPLFDAATLAFRVVVFDGVSLLFDQWTFLLVDGVYRLPTPTPAPQSIILWAAPSLTNPALTLTPARTASGGVLLFTPFVASV